MSHAELLEALQLFFALGDRLESVFYLGKQDFARFRQGNTAGGAVKKRRAKTLFELGDRLGNGRLTDVELARRAGNVAAFGDGIKNVVKIKILFHKFPFPADRQ